MFLLSYHQCYYSIKHSRSLCYGRYRRSLASTTATATNTNNEETTSNVNEDAVPYIPASSAHTSWKSYCINGNTMRNNPNGCVGITAMPSTKTYSVSTTTTAKSGMTTLDTIPIIKNDSHTIYTDLPRNMGGTNVGPQPIELLLMSLIGCMQATAYFVSRHIQIFAVQPSPPSTETISDNNEVVSTMPFIVQYELQHIIFKNITTSRDIRTSIQNIPIQVPYNATFKTTTNTNNDTNLTTIPNHIHDVSGIIIVYFKKKYHHRRRRATESRIEIDQNDIGLNNENEERSEEEKDRRQLYLKTLQQETERRCPIANLIHNSGCKINVIWKDGGSTYYNAE